MFDEKWEKIVFGVIIFLIIWFFIFSGFMKNETEKNQRYFGYGMIAITVVVGILSGTLVGPIIDEKIGKKSCEFYLKKANACPK